MSRLHTIIKIGIVILLGYGSSYIPGMHKNILKANAEAAVSQK